MPADETKNQELGPPRVTVHALGAGPHQIFKVSVKTLSGLQTEYDEEPSCDCEEHFEGRSGCGARSEAGVTLVSAVHGDHTGPLTGPLVVEDTRGPGGPNRGAVLPAAPMAHAHPDTLRVRSLHDSADTSQLVSLIAPGSRHFLVHSTVLVLI
ncbi:hypothetical protein QQF64_034710 [Cirrhinus molitorella]|uniref:Uncharacterized protein n=1 Tax=Cirrhinus molitorella TaxID=172907 RepID=A0ABR3L5V3_9TELE